MSFLENLKKIKPFRAAQDFFGGQGSGGLLGALLSGYGAYKMANPSVNRGFLNQMNQNLAPLVESYERFGELASQYEDPNSEMNQRMRDEIRSQDLQGFIDIANRQRNLATGEYGSYASKAIDRSLMTDAISNALRSFSKGASQRQSTANQLYGQQAQMGNILSQARSQNQLLAQQQGQFLPQYLGQTGLGLLNRAWTQ